MGEVMTMQGEAVEQASPGPKGKRARAPREKSDFERHMEKLSFVKQEKKKPRNHWAVDASSLTYHQQNQLGKMMGSEMLAAVRETGYTPLLTQVVFDWAAQETNRDSSRGVMVGLLHYICDCAARNE